MAPKFYVWQGWRKGQGRYMVVSPSVAAVLRVLPNESRANMKNFGQVYDVPSRYPNAVLAESSPGHLFWCAYENASCPVDQWIDTGLIAT